MKQLPCMNLDFKYLTTNAHLGGAKLKDTILTRLNNAEVVEPLYLYRCPNNYRGTRMAYEQGSNYVQIYHVTGNKHNAESKDIVNLTEQFELNCKDLSIAQTICKEGEKIIKIFKRNVITFFNYKNKNVKQGCRLNPQDIAFDFNYNTNINRLEASVRKSEENTSKFQPYKLSIQDINNNRKKVIIEEKDGNKSVAIFEDGKLKLEDYSDKKKIPTRIILEIREKINQVNEHIKEIISKKINILDL